MTDPRPVVDQSQYDSKYYSCHCGSIPYSRSEPHWAIFFSEVALNIESTLHVKSVFDAGCAIGFLVEALRERGVAAFGRDFSHYAINQIPIELRPYCAEGSIEEPIEGVFDLVTCIEVLEHMLPRAGEVAIERMCAAAPLVLVSSSPTDLIEPTHINVQAPLHWLRLFARHGFGPRADYDASFLCPWAMLLERRDTAPTEYELLAFAQIINDRMAAADSRVECAAVERERQDLQERLYSQATGIAHERVIVQAQIAQLERELSVERKQALEIVEERDALRRAGRDLERACAEAVAHASSLQDRLSAIENSTSWRATQPIRRALNQIPFLHKMIRRSAKIIKWTASGQLLSRLRERISSFDKDMQVVSASGLFNKKWYVETYPEARAFPGGPLAHFMEVGARNSCNPNPFFDVDWYLTSHADAAEQSINPLIHYIRIGWRERARPSTRFDPSWYLETYPDVASEGVEPLAHFLNFGEAEGRNPRAPRVHRPVTRAALKRIKMPLAREEMALFVTHAPHGTIKPHVPVYVDALRRQGVAVTLIVASERMGEFLLDGIEDRVDGLYIRQNQGFDFAAWAHVIRDVDLSQAHTLYLVNDSLIGPLNESSFAETMKRIRSSHAELLCLTDNMERGHHFQSYFLVAKGRAVPELEDFLFKVTTCDSKEEVIDAYEVKLMPYFKERGYAREALFPAPITSNTTITRWRELIADGFPFVKTAVLRAVENSDWREVLSAQGFDPQVAELSVAIIEAGERSAPKPPAAPRALRDTVDDFAFAVPSGLARSVSSQPGRIAVVCHLFHADLAVEIASVLRNIPFPFDVFISTDDSEKKRRIETVFATWTEGKFEVRLVANRGRDIAPKLVSFRDVYPHYDLCLHLHSKESSHHPLLQHWREYLLLTLAGSPEVVRSIFGAFAAAPELGMIAPQHYEPMRQWGSWGGNFRKAADLARRMGLTLDDHAALDFPSGSMFWARTSALKPLLELELAAQDFEPEAGQIDGTLAHAIERLYFVSTEAAGMTWAKVARAEFFGTESRIETVNDASELHDYLGRRTWRVSDAIARPGQETLLPIEATPAPLIEAAQRRALGLDRPAPRLRVAVGVVSYNNDAVQLDRCLRSAGGAAMLMLWDNGEPSTPSPEVAGRLVHEGGHGNLGFGAAHNRLMARAFDEGADIYVCANPDGFFHPAAIDRLARMIEAHDGAALVECIQFPVDHPKLFDDASLRTDWTSGAALAIPRRIYDIVGGFDDGFFMYCEDVDFSWRVRAQGFDVVICPTALFVHEVTNRPSSDVTLRMIAESGARLGQKWGSRSFARWALTQGKGARALAYIGQKVPVDWRDVADFDHGFSFSGTRWS
ncbi:rhamnan synthesis F family protein [Variovorax saccharolyticus]|uniref:rhamnan synthesis F family protein n=1 Tax=Variovorax saccharolyticus TaxID=3053516 RepID=UPI002578B4DB|nr:rhamnan synthesis F family protein [Variovorax sp. J22R187]MDM0017560.1 rhamnan synthesis F family protein [Variovorax sp. J22R187]